MHSSSPRHVESEFGLGGNSPLFMPTRHLCSSWFVDQRKFILSLSLCGVCVFVCGFLNVTQVQCVCVCVYVRPFPLWEQKLHICLSHAQMNTKIALYSNDIIIVLITRWCCEIPVEQYFLFMWLPHGRWEHWWGWSGLAGLQHFSCINYMS